MAEYRVTGTQLTSIANAIRAKAGGSEPLEFPDDFISKVNGIQATIKSQTSSVEIKLTSGLQIGQRELVKLSSTVYLPNNCGPVRSVSMSPQPTGFGALLFFTRYEAGRYYFYVYNSGSTAITLNSPTYVTCSFSRYSASL